jgi:NAD(P)-dependent dehydrogenase (short-subunit alcohol dehydrogenase family)
VARWLGRAGAAVGLVARTARDLEAVAEEVRLEGGEAAVLPGDVADPDDCRSCVAEIVGRFKRLDGLVNNAGIVQPLAPIAGSDPRAWQRNIQVNLVGPYLLTREALAELRSRSGRIVNVSSGAAQLVIESASAYCTAKAGLTHLTRILAAEEPDVVVVALRPGVVDTAMQAELRNADPEAMSPEQTEVYRRLQREGDLVPPQLPARSAAWLVLKAPKDWSGRFLSHDEAEIAGAAEAAFGPPWTD